MKKKDFQREIRILLAVENVSMEQFANFGRIGNGGAEAERWLGCIMRWLCRIQEEYWLEKVQETAVLSLRKNAFTRLRCRNTLQKQAVSDRKKQEINKRTWGLFPQKHEEPEKYMEMMKQAVLLKSSTAFSYKKIIHKEGMDMKKQMEEKTRKGYTDEDCSGGGTNLLVTADMLDEAGIDPEDVIEIFCIEGAVIIRQMRILDRLSDELRECFDATGLSEESLEAALQMEAEETGSVKELLEKLENGRF